MRRGNWALLEPKRICDISERSSLYLKRLYIIETPWFGVFLHAIHRPDHDRVLHDHPWPFASLVLRGGYAEEFAPDWGARLDDNGRLLCSWRRAWMYGSLHRMRRGQFHRISHLSRTPTWTLVFVGRRRSNWGYMTPQGWVDHETFHRTLGLSESDDDF